MRLVFWQNMLSHHQAAHIKALTAQGHDVVIAADQPLSADRRMMGWTAPDFGQARVIVAPDPADIDRLVATTAGEGVHIVGGYRGYRIGRLAIHSCLIHKARVGLMAEAGNPQGVHGILRLLLWRLHWAQFGRQLDFVLAMGDMGVRWFTRCGYARHKCFPYGYFVEPPALPEVEPSSSNLIEFAYVGQCIGRKGLDIALRALAALASHGWHFTVMGDGPARESLQRLAVDLGIATQVTFRPFSDANAVYRQISGSDLLLLPSRFDGWGVVVNEALLSGVPVICTDRCGARDLLRADWRGRVVRAGSVEALTEALAHYVVGPKRTQELTARIRAWATSIQGNSAASYLTGVLEHIYAGGLRPVPPWLRE